MKYICAECKHEQDSMDRPCDKCGSIRVVLRSLLDTLFPGWDTKKK